MTSRREFLKLAALFSAAGALPLLQACSEQAAVAPAAAADTPLTIGYLPITDATPLLVAHGQGLFEKHGVKAVKPVLFRSWAQLVEAFLSGKVNMVHLLSPMTIWARYGSQAKAKVVMWNHMAGSALTVRPNIDSIKQLGGQTVAIPFWYSIHNVVLQYLLRAEGLQVVADAPKAGQVKLVVMPPSDMTPALANGQIAGFIVAEPFNAAAELLGVGKVLRFTADVWRNHACCVTLMNESDLNGRPEWSQKVVDALVEAQMWAAQNRPQTAALLAKTGANQYTPHSEQALLKVLAPSETDWADYQKTGAIRHPEWQQHRIDFQPYPYASYTEELVKMLQQTHLEGENGFLKTLDPAFAARDLVDDRFVKQAVQNPQVREFFRLPENLQRQEQIVA